MAVGSVHRATNTPPIMAREIRKGESPVVTNFVGASALASQVPAAIPQITPSPCSDRAAFFASAAGADCVSSDISVDVKLQAHSHREHNDGNPESRTRQNRLSDGHLPTLPMRVLRRRLTR